MCVNLLLAVSAAVVVNVFSVISSMLCWEASYITLHTVIVNNVT